ncbi:MAG: hypothetical protein MJZ49_08260 [Bacteroidales bacterium]|nr:hypothetical protein [Bacteroidales bacterium]
MKKFLKLTVLFFAVLFLLALSLDVFITHRLHQLKSSPFANWNDIYQTDIQSDAVILGSSRAYVQFSPRILDSLLQINSYNLGANGRSVETQITKYKVFRQHQQKPKLILYEVHAGTMKPSNNYDRIQFTPYLYDSYLWNLVHEKEGFTWADRFVPCWRYLDYQQTIQTILRRKSYYDNPEQFVYKGFVSYDKKWDGTELAKRESITWDRDTACIRMFDEFLAQCKAENVQVVLVLAPYYIGATEKVKGMREMRKMYEKLGQKYGFPLLDYTYDELSQDTMYFYNANHLNRKGVTLFCSKLARDLDSLGVCALRVNHE